MEEGRAIATGERDRVRLGNERPDPVMGQTACVMTSSLERARSAFARQAWGDACDAFTAAAGQASLGADDRERLAVAAYLVGRDDRCEQAWEAAHRVALDAGDPAMSARCAFWLGLCLMLRGQMAQAGGWLATGDLDQAEHRLTRALDQLQAMRAVPLADRTRGELMQLRRDAP